MEAWKRFYVWHDKFAVFEIVLVGFNCSAQRCTSRFTSRSHRFTLCQDGTLLNVFFLSFDCLERWDVIVVLKGIHQQDFIAQHHLAVLSDMHAEHDDIDFDARQAQVRMNLPKHAIRLCHASLTPSKRTS